MGCTHPSHAILVGGKRGAFSQGDSGANTIANGEKYLAETYATPLGPMTLALRGLVNVYETLCPSRRRLQERKEKDAAIRKVFLKDDMVNQASLRTRHMRTPPARIRTKMARARRTSMRWETPMRMVAWWAWATSPTRAVPS